MMIIQNRPAARQIQPMGFSGRLEEIRAPTRGKAKKGEKISRPLRGPVVPQSLGACVTVPACKDKTVSAAPTRNMVTQTAASDHASKAVRALVPPDLRPCCLTPVVTTPLYRITVSRTLRRVLRTKGSASNRRASLWRRSGATSSVRNRIVFDAPPPEIRAALERILAGEWSLARFV